MWYRRRTALTLLSGGLLLSAMTPAVVARAAPDLAGYVVHPALILLEIAPWLLCGGLWVPRRERGAAMITLVLSALMFAGALIAYVPVLWSPADMGGDMSGLYFAAVSFGMIAFVVVGSVVGWVVLLMRRPPNYVSGVVFVCAVSGTACALAGAGLPDHAAEPRSGGRVCSSFPELPSLEACHRIVQPT